MPKKAKMIATLENEGVMVEFRNLPKSQTTRLFAGMIMACGKLDPEGVSTVISRFAIVCDMRSQTKSEFLLETCYTWVAITIVFASVHRFVASTLAGATALLCLAWSLISKRKSEEKMRNNTERKE